ncbi:hypothetical protein B0H19DRAFT_1146399 [Mycena capillaripes]|nr:hypothetical protein B0H19DRAFT_1146399 [Mycena capillaripes]
MYGGWMVALVLLSRRCPPALSHVAVALSSRRCDLPPPIGLRLSPPRLSCSERTYARSNRIYLRTYERRRRAERNGIS